jgi:hypothetical protein
MLNPPQHYTFKSEMLFSSTGSAFNIPTKKPQRIGGIANLI